MVDRTLTEFQERCLGKLSRMLNSLGRHLENVELAGKNETYIHASISNTNVQVWIYEDESMFAGNGIDSRFESPDYDTGEQLMDAFIEEVVKCTDKTP